MSDDKILMPRKLTAENGAKAALIGEFFVEQIIDCPDCDFHSGIADDEICECCNDVGTVTQRLPVTWTTIEAIYEKAVRTLGQPVTSTAQAGDVTPVCPHLRRTTHKSVIDGSVERDRCDDCGEVLSIGVASAIQSGEVKS